MPRPVTYEAWVQIALRGGAMLHHTLELAGLATLEAEWTARRGDPDRDPIVIRRETGLLVVLASEIVGLTADIRPVQSPFDARKDRAAPLLSRAAMLPDDDGGIAVSGDRYDLGRLLTDRSDEGDADAEDDVEVADDEDAKLGNV